MKTISLLLIAMIASIQNEPVKKVDKQKLMGKWYSLFSIPTVLDKHWQETIENYTLRPDGDVDVYTTYKKQGDDKVYAIRSKLISVEGADEGEMKAQFVWPLKVGYRIIELPEDYSYIVIGHPDKKYLFIMSRKRTIDATKLQQIIGRCKTAGYATEKLVSQKHN